MTGIAISFSKGNGYQNELRQNNLQNVMIKKQVYFCYKSFNFN